MDSIERQETASPQGAAPLLAALPERLHHHAYVVKDQEANRRFFEDILGIPLVATWCEKSWRAEIGREIAYCHTFFGLADGSALAFFQFADPEVYALTQAEKPKVGSHYHIALKVGEETYAELKCRLSPCRREVSRDRSRLLQIDLHDDAGRDDPRIHLRPGRRGGDRCDAPGRCASASWLVGSPATTGSTTSCATGNLNRIPSLTKS